MTERIVNRWTRRWSATAIAWVSLGAWAAAAPDVSPHAPSPELPPQLDLALQRATAETKADPRDMDRLRRLASLYQANRLYADARACYATIAASPGGLTARDHYLLADIARNESDLPTMQTELRATLAGVPDYLPARLALADALFKTGDDAGAEKEYLAILEKDPNQPQALLGLARIALQRDDDDGAVARLEDLMAGHPESTAGAALFAKVLERRGDNDRAVAMVQLSQQKPESPPDDPWLDALLADCYDAQRLSIAFEEFFKLGKMKEAVPVLDRLAELDPNGPITKMFAGFSHAKALEHVAAIREYYEALARGGDPEKIGPPLVQSLLALGKVSEAAGLMADFHAKSPASQPIAKAYLQAALKQGDEQVARGLLAELLQKEPYLQSENMSLAKILWSAGERDEAAKCLERVASIYAHDVPSRALLGEYYLGKSDPLAAIKPLEEASAHVSPNTPAQQSLETMLAAAYLQAANREAEAGAWPAAAGHYENLSRVVPTGLEGFAGWANACVQLKQFSRAARALEKMAVLDPDNPTIYLSLGDVLYQDGRVDPARRNWTKAKSLVASGDGALAAALDRRLSGPVTPDLFK